MATERILNFAQLRQAAKDHYEVTDFDVDLPIMDDPDPTPEDEVGADYLSVKEKKTNTKVQL